MAERCFGIVIEGMFMPDTSRPVALTSAAGDDLLSRIRVLGALFTGQYLHSEEALTERNGTIDTSVDPFRVRESHGSFTVRMPATDRIGSQLFRKAYRSAGKTDVVINSSTTTVDFNTTGLDSGPGAIVDTIYGSGSYNPVWIGTEAILVPLSSETAPGSGIYTGCIRGALATTAGEHPAGTYVWDQMPYWVGRKVWLFDAQLNRVPVVKLREVGRISNGFEQDKGFIIVRGSSHLSSLDKRYCNLKPFQLPISDSGLEFKFNEDFLTGAGFGGWIRATSDKWGLNIRKRYRPGGVLAINYAAAFIQYNDNFQYYDRRNNSDYFYSRNINSLLNSKLITPGEEFEKIERNPHFLFCVINPFYDTWIQDGYKGELSRPNTTPLTGTTAGPTRFFGATEGFDDLTINADIKDVYKYHPVAICAALMMSTTSEVANPDEFDLFHPNWSLDIRDAFSAASIAEIHALIKANPWDQVQYLALGKNGEPVRLMEEIRNILQTYSYRLVVNDEGWLSFSKVKLLDVEDRGASLSNSITAVASDLLNFKDGSEDTTPKVFGKYGETPFFEGSTIEITTTLDGLYPSVAVMDENELSVNANTIAELGELRTYLEARAMIMDYQTPRLRIRVAGDTGANLGLGQWVNLSDLPLRDAWLFDKDGNRVAVLNSLVSVRWVGQIIGRRYLINENAYELEIFFINDELIRWRAPSARITGAPQTSQNRIGIAANSAFGDVDGDISRFTVGDEISILRDDGTWVTTTPLTITTIGVDWLEFGSNVSSYNVGDYWVELAYLRTSSGNGYENSNVISGIDRAYAFLGRSPDGKLGTAQLEADQYGG